MANISIADIKVAGASLLTELTEQDLQVSGGGGHGGGYGGKGSKNKGGKNKGGSKNKGGHGGNCGCFSHH